MRPAGAETENLESRFVEWLKERRLPITRQRLLIAQLVLRSDGHPSVDALQRALDLVDERVATATIYRTLDLMVEAGLIAVHNFGDGRRRYEPMAAQSHHEHLVCRRCGQVVEFVNERLERMIRLVADEHNFLLERHRVEIHGLCAVCRGRDFEALSRHHQL